MSVKIGPLLETAITKLEAAAPGDEMVVAAAMGSEEEVGQLPLVVQLPNEPPYENEPWESYRARCVARIEPVRRRLEDLLGTAATPLLAASSLQMAASPDQVRFLQTQPGLAALELDPLVQVVNMDDVVLDVELSGFHGHHPTLTGKGVKVAVLDSGIDFKHPFLHVTDSVSTSGESVEIPGSHATHCAGSIASLDTIFSGIAPDVDLLNIKVLRANGTGQHTSIVRGIDEALDRGANVLSMSVGFNHLPTWSSGGHGWACPDGLCPLCTAVDNAVRLDGVFAVVAAGNEHDRAEALRANGFGGNFDTEVSCPGHAREALTVGAITKKTFLPASFSSHGPSADGRNKPDVCAPGVNITSTIPAPRQPDGSLVPSPSRASLFGVKSGTSMATPIVAGVVALLIQRQIDAGVKWTPKEIRKELIDGLAFLPDGVFVVGSGRITLLNL
jgi:serine protease AprX